MKVHKQEMTTQTGTLVPILQENNLKKIYWKSNLLIYSRTMSAFENTKLKETQYLKTYMDPMAKTTTLI